MTERAAAVQKIPVYCYQCVAGPDLLKVIVKDGVAVGVEPNSDMADDPSGMRQGLRPRLWPDPEALQPRAGQDSHAPHQSAEGP